MPQKSKPEDVHCLLQKMILWSADNPGDYVTKYVRADLAHESPLRMGQRQKNGKIQFSSYEMGIIDEARDFFQIFKTNKRQEVPFFTFVRHTRLLRFLLPFRNIFVGAQKLFSHLPH